MYMAYEILFTMYFKRYLIFVSVLPLVKGCMNKLRRAESEPFLGILTNLPPFYNLMSPEAW